MGKVPFEEPAKRKKISELVGSKAKISEDLISLVSRYREAFENKGRINRKVAKTIALLDKDLKEIRYVFNELVRPLVNLEVFFVAEWHKAHIKQGMYNSHWHINSVVDPLFFSGFDLEYLIRFVLKCKIEMHVSKKTARLHIFKANKEEIKVILDRLNKFILV